MKNSIASILICAIALTHPLTSPAAEIGKNYGQKKEGVATVNASLYRISHSNNVRLMVEAKDNDLIRVFLKDKSGKTFYSKSIKRIDMQDKQVFSIIFNMDGMQDGTYFVYVRDKSDNSLVKEINVENLHTKVISFK